MKTKRNEKDADQNGGNSTKISRTTYGAEMKEGYCRLSAGERGKIGHAIPMERTTNIQIEEAYMLFEAMGSAMASIYTGGNDVSHVRIVQ